MSEWVIEWMWCARICLGAEFVCTMRDSKILPHFVYRIRWLAGGVTVCRITNSQNRDNNHLVLSSTLSNSFSMRRASLFRNCWQRQPVLACVRAFYLREKMEIVAFRLYNELNEWIIRRKRRWTARAYGVRGSVFFVLQSIQCDGRWKTKCGNRFELNACSASIQVPSGVYATVYPSHT